MANRGSRELKGGDEFCFLSEMVIQKIHYIIEWLRSRLPGYPDYLVPHTAPNANICGQESQIARLFPWLNHLFYLKFESKSDFLTYIQNQKTTNHYLNILDQSVAELVGQLINTDAWQSFNNITNELDDDDVTNLVIFVNEFQKKTRKAIVTYQAGKSLYRIAQYKSSILSEIESKADDKLKDYYKKFEDVEWLLQIITYLLSSLVIYGPIKRIEQYDTFIADRNKTAVSDKIIKINMKFNFIVLRLLHIGQVFYFKNELTPFEGALVVSSYSIGTNEMTLKGQLLKNSIGEF